MRRPRPPVALPSAAATEKTRLDAFRAGAEAAGRALGGVPVELRAVLGTVELSLADLKALQPGAASHGEGSGLAIWGREGAGGAIIRRVRSAAPGWSGAR